MVDAFSIVSWNIRGLNSPTRCEVVHNLVLSARMTLHCLQERKMSIIDSTTATEILSPRLVGFQYLSTINTWGGILIGWNEDLVMAINSVVKHHSLSMMITVKETNYVFFMTVVYAPPDDPGKLSFLQEIQSLKPVDSSAWLVVGDFNMIYQARDKSNLNLNRSLMGSFRHTLDSYELFEFNLQNQKFTWSNERAGPTLVRLDRVFCNKEWDLLLSNFNLLALSSPLSDHCPLVLY
jgi:exonuclease III